MEQIVEKSKDIHEKDVLMKRTWIKLFAGLGNQLFQLAYGDYLLHSGESVSFIIRKTPDCINDIFDLSQYDIKKFNYGIIEKLFRFILKATGRKIPWDFYQEEKYSHNISKTISSLFKRDKEYEQSQVVQFISTNDPIALHIRGGDYLIDTAKVLYGGICDESYYLKALSAVPYERPVLVFTNDRAHADEILKNAHRKMTYAEDLQKSRDTGLDLYAMSKCTSLIISNSTFAWWAARICYEDKAKTVFAPSRWNNQEKNNHLLVTDWNIIQVEGGSE